PLRHTMAASARVHHCGARSARSARQLGARAQLRLPRFSQKVLLGRGRVRMKRCPSAAFAGTLEGRRATCWSMLFTAARIRRCVLVVPILAGACPGDDAESADGLSGTSFDADTRTT